MRLPCKGWFFCGFFLSTPYFRRMRAAGFVDTLAPLAPRRDDGWARCFNNRKEVTKWNKACQ
jgi:hypothetical protein